MSALLYQLGLRARWLVAGACLLCGLSRTHANPLDAYGFGGRGPALAGAVGALVEDAAAAFYNPAGLALGTQPTFLVGYGAAIPRLTFDGRAAPAEAARGVSLGLAIPRTLGSTTLAFGAALYFPDQRLVRIRAQPATEPRFSQYDNRVHRLAVHPALGFRPWPWLSIGAGLSILADAKGAGTDLDVTLNLDRAQDPTAQRASASLDVQLPTRIAPVVGVWARLHERLRASLVWRGSISLDVALDTRVKIDAGLLRGLALTGLSSSDYYTPHTLAFGLAFDVTKSIVLSAEATWYRWSAAPSPVPLIRAALDLGLPIDIVNVSVPSAAYQPWDIVVARLGAEGRLRPRKHLELAWRAGFAYEPTPLPRQTGLTSLADNDKVVFTAGFGLSLEDLGGYVAGPLRVDVYLQSHVMRDRAHPKALALPTPSFVSRGELWVLGTAVSLGF